MSRHDEECERWHLMPSLSKFTFKPMSIPEPWWYRQAWAGWYWLEFAVLQWNPAFRPKQPALTFGVTIRFRGRTWRLIRVIKEGT